MNRVDLFGLSGITVIGKHPCSDPVEPECFKQPEQPINTHEEPQEREKSKLTRVQDPRCFVQLPDGSTVAQNVRVLQQQLGMERAAGGSGADTLLRWLLSVWNHGPQDYKQASGYDDGIGNFNYAVTGTVFFSQEILQRGAGAAQWLFNPRMSEGGWPFGAFPYGDQVQDQLVVVAGAQADCN